MRIALLAAMAACCAVSPALAAPAADHSPRFLVHLLDYLAKDYAGAVRHGRVISRSEYEEQTELVERAREAGRDAKEVAHDTEVQNGLVRLQAQVAAKAEPEAVARTARAIQMHVIQMTGMDVAPLAWPSLERGRAVFAANCVTCHGATGHGDGPAAAALNPKPANFFDPDRMREISPFHIFNTVRLGIPGTPMAPLPQLTDTETWNVAFYVQALRYQGEPVPEAEPERPFDSIALQAAASLADHALKARGYSVAAVRLHEAREQDGGASLDVARAGVKRAVEEYSEGHAAEARTIALQSYLDGIEPVEPRLRATDPARVDRLESRMSAVRAAIERRAPPAEVARTAKFALEAIDDAAALLVRHGLSPTLAFLTAAAILLREGFEAVLVILALLGVIRAAKSREAALWVHGGWVAALALGFGAWFASGWLLALSGANREMMEGVTSLFAVAVLLYMGFWMHRQTELGRWKKFIHGKVQAALKGRNLYGLATISFVAVFREAFETVLFVRAIWLESGDTGRTAVALGVFFALAAVIGLAWVTLRFSARIPVRRVFTLSSFLMVVLAVVLLGKGIHSLQETGVLGVTSVPLPFYSDIAGIYPTTQTLVPQLVLVALLSVAYWARAIPAAAARRRAPSRRR